MKAVMISIRPKWCELIASGKKTLEVKKTKPKLETPFKCYIYCTNTKPYLVWGDVFRGDWETEFTHLSGYNKKDAEKIWDVFNGKVIGEFVCDGIDTYDDDTIHSFSHEDYCRWNDFDLNRSCIHPEDFENYANDKWIYGWHISDLKIYDEPKKLNEFMIEDKIAVKKCTYRFRAGQPETVTKHGGWIQGGFGCLKSGIPEWCDNCLMKPLAIPPQSWCYVNELERLNG